MIFMFIAKRKVKRKKKSITYYVLVKTVYNTKGKPRQKMIKYLGTAEKIYGVFSRKTKKKKRSK